jgi:thermitase
LGLVRRFPGDAYDFERELMKVIALFLLMCLFALAGPVPPHNRIIVGMRIGKEADIFDLVRSYKHHVVAQIRMGVIEVPEPALPGILKSLQKRKDLFTYVEEDGVGLADAKPNDPLMVQQSWTVKSIFQSPTGTPGAWDISKGGATVAVIDSGIDGTHPDLKGKVLAGWDFLKKIAVPAGINSDTGCNTGHGTAVAGTIVASTDNSIGIAGGAWMSSVIPLVVTSAPCYAYWSDVAAATVYAADHARRLSTFPFGVQQIHQDLNRGFNMLMYGTSPL